MVLSMTGYGRFRFVCDEFSIFIKIKSLNHRFFDCYINIPKSYDYVEEAIRNRVKTVVSRGKINVDVFIDCKNIDSGKVIVNEKLISAYVNSFNEVCVKFNIKNDVSASLISKLNCMFIDDYNDMDEKFLSQNVIEVLDRALDDFSKMRKKEGLALKQDLVDNFLLIKNEVDYIESKKEEIKTTLSNKFYNDISLLIDDDEIMSKRVMLEVSIIMDKLDISEEVVRLKSLMSQFLNVLDEVGCKGKKLDFILQEMNREVNTIVSKSSSYDITKKIIQLKDLIEKAKEQVQNIE